MAILTWFSFCCRRHFCCLAVRLAKLLRYSLLIQCMGSDDNRVMLFAFCSRVMLFTFCNRVMLFEFCPSWYICQWETHGSPAASALAFGIQYHYFSKESNHVLPSSCRVGNKMKKPKAPHTWKGYLKSLMVITVPWQTKNYFSVLWLWSIINGWEWEWEHHCYHYSYAPVHTDCKLFPSPDLWTSPSKAAVLGRPVIIQLCRLLLTLSAWKDSTGAKVLPKSIQGHEYKFSVLKITQFMKYSPHFGWMSKF